MNPPLFGSNKTAGSSLLLMLLSISQLSQALNLFFQLLVRFNVAKKAPRYGRFLAGFPLWFPTRGLSRVGLPNASPDVLSPFLPRSLPPFPFPRSAEQVAHVAPAKSSLVFDLKKRVVFLVNILENQKASESLWKYSPLCRGGRLNNDSK